MRRRKFSPTERALIVQRAHGCCEYCHTPLDFSPESFEVEHIVPLSKGGTNELENLALSCGGCNGRKSDRLTGIDPQTNASVPCSIRVLTIGQLISLGATIFPKWKAQRPLEEPRPKRSN